MIQESQNEIIAKHASSDLGTYKIGIQPNNNIITRNMKIHVYMYIRGIYFSGVMDRHLNTTSGLSAIAYISI